MNCCGWWAASTSADEPPIENPTTALPVDGTFLLAAKYAGSSCVRNVSHL